MKCNEECEVYSRDKKGKFVETTGNGKYNRIIRNGKNMQHSRYVWEQVNGPIPTGQMIHHKNGNKKDDRLENLQLMTYKKHNQHHVTGRTPWNKGKKCPNISKSKIGHKVLPEQIKKVKRTWKNKYLVSMRNINFFKDEGFSYKKIGEMTGITKYCAIARHIKYLNDYQGESGLL